MITGALADIFDRVQEGPNGCWLWTGSQHKQGYGQLGAGLAHREVYRITRGFSPKQMELIPAIRHRCDVPACVNPLHLEPGTQGENIEDYLRRGRARELRGNPASAKLTVEKVIALRRRVRAGERIMAVAAELGISKSGAYQAARGKTWQFVDEPPVLAAKETE